jgi:hypothetical protein
MSKPRKVTGKISFWMSLDPISKPNTSVFRVFLATSILIDELN